MRKQSPEPQREAEPSSYQKKVRKSRVKASWPQAVGQGLVTQGPLLAHDVLARMMHTSQPISKARAERFCGFAFVSSCARRGDLECDHKKEISSSFGLLHPEL